MSMSQQAYNYLMNIHLLHWIVHAFDHETKVDHITNNVVETTNKWVKPTQKFANTSNGSANHEADN